MLMDDLDDPDDPERTVDLVDPNDLEGLNDRNYSSQSQEAPETLLKPFSLRKEIALFIVLIVVTISSMTMILLSFISSSLSE